MHQKYFIGWCATLIGMSAIIAGLGWRGVVGGFVGMIGLTMLDYWHRLHVKALTRETTGDSNG